MMRDTARKFTAEEVTPLANKLDSERGDIPRELILKMGELGFHGILIPEEYGGVGLGADQITFPTGFGGAGGNGGGIQNNGSLISIFCTVVWNSTGEGGNSGNFINYQNLSDIIAPTGGAGGNGGGYNNGANAAAAILRNNIIGLNTVRSGGLGGTVFSSPFFETFQTNGAPGSDGFGPDLSGDFTSHGFNLIGASDGSTGFTNGVNADQVGSSAAPIDPLIGPLQMNGGPTPTHALLPGSPAIDQGKSFGQKFDQRGHLRPHDYLSIPNAPGGDGSDIGAFELDN